MTPIPAPFLREPAPPRRPANDNGQRPTTDIAARMFAARAEQVNLIALDCLDTHVERFARAVAHHLAKNGFDRAMLAEFAFTLSPAIAEALDDELSGVLSGDEK